MSLSSKRKRVTFCQYDFSSLDPPDEGVKDSEVLSLNLMRHLSDAVSHYYDIFEKLTQNNFQVLPILEKVLEYMKNAPECHLIKESIEFLITKKIYSSPLTRSYDILENSPIVYRLKSLVHSLLRYSFRRFLNPPIERRPLQAKVDAKNDFSEGKLGIPLLKIH